VFSSQQKDSFNRNNILLCFFKVYFYCMDFSLCCVFYNSSRVSHNGIVKPAHKKYLDPLKGPHFFHSSCHSALNRVSYVPPDVLPPCHHFSIFYCNEIAKNFISAGCPVTLLEETECFPIEHV